MTDKIHPHDKDCAFVLPEEASHYSCPANVWVWLIHSFLQRTANIKPKNLEAEYSKVLQQELGRDDFFPGVEVYWAPAKEKASISELHHETSRHGDNVCPRDFQGAFSSLLIDLNNSYHSQYALRKFSDALQKHGECPAFVYLVRADNDAIRLTFLNQDNMQSRLSGKEKDLTLSFCRDGIPEPCDFYQSLKKKYDHFLTDKHVKEMTSAVREYIESWNDDASIEPETTLIGKSELLEAAKHFVLMALYMSANNKGGASYFLAPSLYPRHDSTMVIYWPEDIPDRNLHFLLQLILKLNAYPLISAESFRESVLAQKHNINNLNPLADLSRASVIFSKENLTQEDRQRGLFLLNESYNRLQLLTVSLSIAFDGGINESKLVDLDTFEDLFDFFIQARPRSLYSKLKTNEPVVSYFNGAKKIKLSKGLKKPLFSCLWNLWHNAGKAYGELEPRHFWVVLHLSEKRLDISFINEGEIEPNAAKYLLDEGPYPREAKKEGKGGLEILKETLDELSAEIVGVYVAGKKTNVKIRFSGIL